MCLTEEIIDKVLKLHNDYRLIHHAEPLKYSLDIGQMAQNHALKLAETEKLEHSDYSFNDEPIGENLARWRSGDSETDGLAAVRSWYEEVIDYDFNLNAFQQKAGHFSQLVWKSTQYLGFGLAKSPNGTFYAVGFYFPSGNFENEYINNVGKSEQF